MKLLTKLYNIIAWKFIQPYWHYISLWLLAIFIVSYYLFGKTIDSIIIVLALTLTGILFLSGSFFTTYSLYESIREFKDDPAPFKHKLGGIFMTLIGIAFFYYFSYWFITKVILS